MQSFNPGCLPVPPEEWHQLFVIFGIIYFQLKTACKESFPCGPVVKTPGFHSRGHPFIGSVPGWKNLCATQGSRERNLLVLILCCIHETVVKLLTICAHCLKVQNLDWVPLYIILREVGKIQPSPSTL